MVLDSWPLVEWLKGHQPVESSVTGFLEDAARKTFSLSISRINLGELIYIGRKEIGLPDREIDRTLQILRRIPVHVFSATDARVDAAVDLKSRYKISYADAFAAALSIELNAPLVTGDKEFRTLEADGLLQLHWLGA
jgi:predicted nucleic acid-binding protein